MVVDIRNLTTSYEVLMLDPPWPQSKGGRKSVRPNSSGSELDYKTISLDEIKEHLRLATNATTDNAVLFLWTIEKYLIEAQTMAEELGWKLHCRMIWDKEIGIPSAFTVQFGHEYLMWMYKGKFQMIAEEWRGKVHSVFHEKAKRHSQKPEVAYKIIESFYSNAKRLEMYARTARRGWDAFGNEVTDDGCYQLSINDLVELGG